MKDTYASAPSVLIVCLRYIGDVLVSTPLAASIKEQLPAARIDYLVFQGTEVALAKNPFVERVITMPRGSKSMQLAASLWNRYDIAIAAGTSDRTVIFSSIAGRIRSGLDYGYPRDFWKRFLLRNHVSYDDNRHVVWNMLASLGPLNIQPLPRVVMGYDREDMMVATRNFPPNRFVIMHPYSRSGYKCWPAKQWGELANLVTARLGMEVVFTITPALEDRALLEDILADAPRGVSVLSEPLTLNQLAAGLSIASAYVGGDTVVTHIAAAVGAQTIALYGPTLTRYWAPWPGDCNDISPFIANKGVQRVGNVTVVQKGWECVPCNKESCTVSTRNKIECLEKLSAEEVFEVIRLSVKPEVL